MNLGFNGGGATKGTSNCLFNQHDYLSHIGFKDNVSIISNIAKGTKVLPANFFEVGKQLKFRLRGFYTTDASSGNATITIKIGSSIIRTTDSFPLNNNVTNGYWDLEGCFTCQSVGVNGAIAGSLVWNHAQSSGNILLSQPMNSYSMAVLDTTISGEFDVTWSASDLGTIITTTECTLWENF
jgi:hypothetical protein